MRTAVNKKTIHVLETNTLTLLYDAFIAFPYLMCDILG